MLHSLWEKIIIITVSPRFYQNHHHYSLTTISITINQNLFVHKPTIPQSLNLDPTNLFQPFHNQKKLITNHVDVNGPTKLFPVRLINFHTRTHIVTWIALRWSRRAERERSRLPDETESHQNGRESVRRALIPRLARARLASVKLVTGAFPGSPRITLAYVHN